MMPSLKIRVDCCTFVAHGLAHYLNAHHDFLSGKIESVELETSRSSDIATRANIDKLSVIGEGCVIKPGVHVINSVIGAGVHIEEKAVIENSVIWSHTRISSAAEIRNAVIGRKTTLTDNTKV